MIQKFIGLTRTRTQWVWVRVRVRVRVHMVWVRVQQTRALSPSPTLIIIQLKCMEHKINIVFCQLSGEIPCNIRCEPINITQCTLQSYSNTGFPNFFDHLDQTQAAEYANYVDIALLANCSEHSTEFLCGLLLPECRENEGFILPSRQICNEFYNGSEFYTGCMDLLSALKHSEDFLFDCNAFPENPEPVCSVKFSDLTTEAITTMPTTMSSVTTTEKVTITPSVDSGSGKWRNFMFLDIIISVNIYFTFLHTPDNINQYTNIYCNERLWLNYEPEVTAIVLFAPKQNSPSPNLSSSPRPHGVSPSPANSSIESESESGLAPTLIIIQLECMEHKINIVFCQLSGEIPCNIPCEPINITQCTLQSYSNTGFPNFFDHLDQTQAAEYANYVDIALIANCSEHSTEFLCGLLLPECRENEGFILPSRQICNEFYNGSEFYTGCVDLLSALKHSEDFLLDCNAFPENPEPVCSVKFSDLTTEATTTMPTTMSSVTTTEKVTVDSGSGKWRRNFIF